MDSPTQQGVVGATTALVRTLLGEDSTRTHIRAILVLALLGGAAGVARATASAAWNTFWSWCTTTAEITSKEEVYRWIVEFLSVHPYAKTATRLSISTQTEQQRLTLCSLLLRYGQRKCRLTDPQGEIVTFNG